MAAGFQVYNDSGQLQVDSDSFLFYLVTKGTETSVARGTFGNTTPSKIEVTVPKTYTNPMVAISCSSMIAEGGRTSDTNNYYFTYACAGSVGTSFTYYVFQSYAALTTGNFGIEVYDASGKITFTTSQSKPLRIIGLLTSLTDSETFTGRSVAVVHQKTLSERYRTSYVWYENGVATINEPPYLPAPSNWELYESWYYHLWGASASGATATSGTVSFDDVTTGPTNDFSNSPEWADNWRNLLIVDVTNY